MTAHFIHPFTDWRSAGTSNYGPSSVPDTHHLHDLSGTGSRGRFPTISSPVTPSSGGPFNGRVTKSTNHIQSRNGVVPDFTRSSSSFEGDLGGVHVRVEREVIKMDYGSGVSSFVTCAAPRA